MRSQIATAFTVLAVALGLIAARPAFQISYDRDLKEINLASWDCRDRLEGTGKTADGTERNRLKNRSAPALPGAPGQPMDTASFLKQIGDFDAQTHDKRREDLSAAQRQQLNQLEKQSVSLTAYLVLAYPGPPESTNCGSADFHDWHLELFEKPQDHPPGIGDRTPIICEITPRTQSAIYRDGIRIQELAAFFRQPDLTIEPTGHPAQKIRVTGYLLWDDDHNGTSDVGTTVRTGGVNRYHNPWRSTAWEVHPIYKIERLDAVSAEIATAAPAPQPPPRAPVQPAPALSPPRPQQFVTITQPAKIKIPYGETTLPPGTKLPVVSRDSQTVTVRYMGGNYLIPITSTDLH